MNAKCDGIDLTQEEADEFRRTHTLKRAIVVTHRGAHCATADDRDEPTHLCSVPMTGPPVK